MPTADGHIAFFVIAALATAAASASPAVDDFKRMSLEELMDVEVYSASRRLEPTRAAPSAIFVLTGEDIRRARVTTIPDALRLVPGVQVGRVDANKWAVSIRGFNAREANKLLVLIDGRSIYDPLFSGVLWESHDLMLEDIDRIEVIRGPGGTLWGANAFNGVISIVSKRAADTQGALIAASAGSEERYSSALRYGWQPGNNQSARVYVKARANDTGYSPRVPAHDESQMARGGVRWDWQPTSADDVNVSAEAFDVDADIRESAIQVQDVKHDGHNVTTHWNHVIAPDNSLRAQLYYDHVSYESFGFDQERRTYDLELQQTVEPVK